MEIDGSSHEGREAADRYRDAREMAEEVRAYLTGGRVQAYNYGAWTLAKRWAARPKCRSAATARK